MSANARDIDRFLSGSWFNPAQAGHGFSVEVSTDGQVVIYWYTYHPDGTPTFILVVGQAEDNKVSGPAYYNTGMHFGEFDPADRTEDLWGEISVTFHDCDSATVEYDSTFEHEGEPFGSGSFPIERLVSIDQLQCQEDRRAGIYEGLVYSDADDEAYYGFVLVAPGGEFAAYSDGGVGSFGNVTVSGRNLHLSGVSVSLDPDDQFFGEFTGNGDFSAEYRLYSSYDVDEGDSGYGDFYSSSALYRRTITLERLADSYELYNPTTGRTGTLTVLGNGNISGSDESGCQFAGKITIPDTRFNVFEASVTVSSCSGFNATYTGLGSEVDWYRVDDRRGLRLLVTDDEFAFLWIANR